MLAAVIVSCSNQETEAPKEPPVQEETRVAPADPAWRPAYQPARRVASGSILTATSLSSIEVKVTRPSASTPGPHASWSRSARDSHGLAIGPNNDVWVTDTKRHQILRFSHDGELRQTFGERGVRNGFPSGSNMKWFERNRDRLLLALDTLFADTSGTGKAFARDESL